MGIQVHSISGGGGVAARGFFFWIIFKLAMWGLFGVKNFLFFSFFFLR